MKNAAGQKRSNNVQKHSACTLFGCFPRCRKQQKLKCLVNRSYVQARQLEQIIARRIADAAKRSSSRSVAIHCVNSRRPLTGLNCSLTEKSSRQKRSQIFDGNVTN